MRRHDGFEPCGVEVRWMGEGRGGYGGSATRRIAAGDVLVRVPRSAMLTADEARDCEHVGAACAQLSEWQALVLKLMHERDVHEGYRAVMGSDTPGSEWSAWLAMLPDVEKMRATHPLLWSEERRSAYLEGSPTLIVLERLLEECVRDRDAIVGALARSGSDASVWEDEDEEEEEEEEEEAHRHTTDQETDLSAAWPSLDDVLWAQAIITSRAFYLSRVAAGEDADVDAEDSPGAAEGAPGEFTGRTDLDPDVFEAFGGGQPWEDDPWETPDTFLALVPWADALNHDVEAGPEALLTYNPTTQVAEIIATRDAAPGDEVFDSYGPGKSRSDLLINYGFVAMAASPPTKKEKEKENDNENENALPADEDEWSTEWAADVVDITGEAFFAEAAGLVDTHSSDTKCQTTHLASLRSLLGAIGMDVSDTTVRVTADGVSGAAADWCLLAASTADELEAAANVAVGHVAGDGASFEGSEEDAWAVAAALMDGPGAEAREARARRVLARVCEAQLARYPKWAHDLTDDERAGGAGGAGHVTTGAAAAGALLASEIRALKGALASASLANVVQP